MIVLKYGLVNEEGSASFYLCIVNAKKWLATNAVELGSVDAPANVWKLACPRCLRTVAVNK